MKKNEERRQVCLAGLSPEEEAFVEKIEMPHPVRVRLSDLGMNTGARVVCLGSSPFGDPRAYLVRGRIIALRTKDAKNIICKIR